MKRKASAVWQGGLKDGKGTVSTESGVLQNTAYSFGTRFENAKGTNPEELVAAAHAGCFAMALSAQLGERGLTAEKLEASATATLEKVEAGWSVTSVHLDVRGKVSGADAATFEKAANAAKTGCPISRLLNTTITMDAKLVA
ncbi:MAG: OsmC family peroxiredoxin [Nitrospiraceae bacterium]